MTPTLIGELAALAASLCFTNGSTFFTFASRRIGVMVLNRTRLVIALVLLSLAHLALYGKAFPTQAGLHQWLWLGASGIVGLAFGDVFLFSGYASIGPRLTMLMMSLSPLLATILAWIIFRQTLSIWQVTGILTTLGGIAWVVMDHHGSSNNVDQPALVKGLWAGVGAAVCQAAGLILARQGLGGDFSPLSGNFIRMLCASSVFWLFTLLQGQVKTTFATLKANPRGLLFAFIGAFSGPFLGVSFSMLSIQKAEVGVASTIMALPPVFLLPISYFIFKERVSWQAVAGTILAIAGTGLLFLV